VTVRHHAPGPCCVGLTFRHALQVNAWLSHIKTENFAYPACTLQYNGKQCNKKVSDSGGGAGDMQWYCERCGSYCQAEWRYMLNLQLEDHTGKEWVTAFQVCLSCCTLRAARCVIVREREENQFFRRDSQLQERWHQLMLLLCAIHCPCSLVASLSFTAPSQCEGKFILRRTVGSAIFCPLQDEAKALVGRSADDMQKLKEASSPEFDEVLNAVKCKFYIVKLRISEDTWQDEQRIRINMVRWAISTCVEARSALKSTAEFMGAWSTYPALLCLCKRPGKTSSKSAPLWVTGRCAF
jgi:hypothetical protein